ncbi:MAG TPA: ubiquinone/menaquinone biosynthesis methyltransferase [Candidatus Binatia bacterium]|nr:ubiquinone/menaquinone biosynthesis methyltransferase [Candidatus Binatia bacterium]
MLKPMFSTVAETYDLSNKVLTFGLDKRWRKACAKQSTNGHFIVDLCCGTGDLSLSLMKNLKDDSFLLGLDFSKEMLSKAIIKKSKSKWANKDNFAFVIADAAHLPLKNDSVDTVKISFSFRNLIYRNPNATSYLKEVTRMLKQNGDFACVETSQPKNRFIKSFFHFYCIRLVPLIGGWISGAKPAYKYLGKSAANFPPPKEIMAMLKKAGFDDTSFEPLSFGVVGLYTAMK